jgi:hypothetical protein
MKNELDFNFVVNRNCPTCKGTGVLVDVDEVDEVMSTRRARLVDIPRGGFSQTCRCCIDGDCEDSGLHLSCTAQACEHTAALAERKLQTAVRANELEKELAAQVRVSERDEYYEDMLRDQDEDDMDPFEDPDLGPLLFYDLYGRDPGPGDFPDFD